jgi:hypothetical protein
VPHKSNFFLFALNYFDWPFAKKKLKLWRLPQNEGSFERCSASHFGAKHMGLKQGAIGNTFGAYWELEGNMLGTKEK